MKIITKIGTSMVLLLFAAATLWAGPLTGGAASTSETDLHEFFPDTVASALEVNDNFVLVRKEVNDNDTRITTLDGDVIKGVTAGSGLTGGGTSGNITISVGTGAITSTHLATNSVYAAEIATSAVGTSEIADGSVTGTDIANNTITSADIADEPRIKEQTTSIWVSIPSADYADLNYITFTAPASGRVLVSASGSLSLTKTSSSTTGFWGLDLHNAPDTAPGVTPMSGSKSASRGYIQSSWTFTSAMGIPFYIQEVFSVTSGQTYTFYLNGKATGFSAAYLFHPTMVAIFIPGSM